MGWWGHDVLSGDTPLDILDSYAQQMELPDEHGLYPSGTFEDGQAREAVAAWFETSSFAQIRESVRRACWWRSDQELADYADQCADDADRVAAVEAQLREGRDDDERIAWQVLAVVAMAAGVPLTDELRERMTSAATDDRWADDDPARRAAMDRYVATLRDYDATPTALPSATLNDAADRAEQAGHRGLLNVGRRS